MPCDRRDRPTDFLRDVARLVAAAKEELAVPRVFLAPLDVDQEMLRRIEGAIARSLRADDRASSLLPTDVRYRSRKPNVDPIFVHIESPCRILGQPEVIQAETNVRIGSVGLHLFVNR